MRVLEFRRLLADTNSRVKPLSSHLARLKWIPLLLLPMASSTAVAQGGPQAHDQKGPQQLFEQGQSALKKGDLNEAQRDFRAVLAFDPNAPAVYANLGVIAMRRKHWTEALELLHRAETLAPDLPGIRLNIGLVYYRQANYRSAVPPFESVVHDDPASLQARYLLGLC